MKKGEIIEDVYYTMEEYSYLMAGFDLSMSMRWKWSAEYIAGDWITMMQLQKENVVHHHFGKWKRKSRQTDLTRL